jgi:hypothetical protein
MKIGFWIDIWRLAPLETSGSSEGFLLIPRDIPLDLYIAALIRFPLPEGEAGVRVFEARLSSCFQNPLTSILSPLSARGEADFIGDLYTK